MIRKNANEYQLKQTFEDYIQEQLEIGTYNNASEVAREARRLNLQQNELYQIKLKALRDAIIEGEDSGKSTPFDIHGIIEEARNESGS